ncbi:hypothetical protein CDAR_537391, partial [Caerostris darwini]
MTPRVVFNVLCGDTIIGRPKKDLASRSDFDCKALAVSTSRSPERSFLTDLDVSNIPLSPFSTAKGDFDTAVAGIVIIKNLENEAVFSML